MMIEFDGDLSEYREHPRGSRQFWRFVDGEPVGQPTWVREGLTFAEIYARRANPPEPEPDPRDAKIAELEAGVLSDKMIDAERAKTPNRTAP